MPSTGWPHSGAGLASLALHGRGGPEDHAGLVRRTCAAATQPSKGPPKGPLRGAAASVRALLPGCRPGLTLGPASEWQGTSFAPASPTRPRCEARGCASETGRAAHGPPSPAQSRCQPRAQRARRRRRLPAPLPQPLARPSPLPVPSPTTPSSDACPSRPSCPALRSCQPWPGLGSRVAGRPRCSGCSFGSTQGCCHPNRLPASSASSSGSWKLAAGR